jgi:hypothetical protein
LADTTLAVDQIGVGRPVLDMLRRSTIAASIRAFPRGVGVVTTKKLDFAKFCHKLAGIVTRRA